MTTTALAPLETPFATTPNPRYFYLAPQYKTILNHLISTAVYREGLAIVAGPIGCGKSTMLRFLIEWLAANQDDARVIYLENPKYSSDLQLLKAICADVDLPMRPTKVAQLAELKVFLHEQAVAGRVVLLIVDEAHQLSGPQFELIRELFNFCHGERFMVQVILAGEEAPLHHRLKGKKALLSRAMYYDTLEPLTVDEVGDLVRFRLRVADLPEDIFTDSAIARIAEAAQGRPRTVVKVARHVVAAADKGARAYTAEMVDAVLAANRRLTDA